MPIERQAGPRVSIEMGRGHLTSYGRSAVVLLLCSHPYFGRRQPMGLWLLVRRRCWHPNLRRQQPLEMWLLVRRSGFTAGAVCAGTGRTCGPFLVDQIELAWIATTRTAAVSANATRATLSLDHLRGRVT